MKSLLTNNFTLTTFCEIETRIFAKVNNENDNNSPQNGMDNLVDRSDKWLLKFNVSKSKHIHIVPITNSTYKMNNEEITTATVEKDFRITIDDKLNLQFHINNHAKKTNQNLGLINRTFN